MRPFTAALLALVIRPLLRERLRSALTVGGIAVGIAVLVAIQLSNQSALRSFHQSVDAISGRANHQIAADSGLLDESLLLSLQRWWPAGLRFAPMLDLDGAVAGAGTPIRILGVDLVSDLHFRDYRYARVITEKGGPGSVAGRLALFRHDSVIVPQTFADEQKLALGDPIYLNAAGKTQRFVVRGILRPSGPATAFNGSLAIFDIANVQRAFELRGRLSRIDLLVPPDSEARVVAEIRQSLAEGIRLERPSRRSLRVERMLRAFRVNLMALAAVSLLVGIFLVYNTVLVSILRRRHLIGVLRTLGVSPRQIFGLFVVEAAGFGAAGSLLGIMLGYALSWSTLGLIARTINALYVTTSPREIALTPLIVVSAVATGVVIAVVSALQPALEAASIPPAVVLREGTYQRLSTRRSGALALFALFAFAVAGGLSMLPPVDTLPLGGYGAVLFVVAGFSLLTPLVLHGVAASLRPLLRRIFRLAGDLASASLPASLRRTAIAAAALTIAIAMMVAVSLMIGSFRETVAVWVGQTVQSDLWLRPSRVLASPESSTFPPEILTALRRIEEIEAVDPYRGREILYRGAPVTIGSGDLAVVLDHGGLPMLEPRSDRAALKAALRDGGVIVSESFARKFGHRVGEAIAIPVPGGSQSFPIRGIYRDYSSDRGIVVMDRTMFLRHFDDPSINTIAVFLREGVPADTGRRAIERALVGHHAAFVFTNRTIRDEVMKVFDQTFMITYALLIVAIVVAVLGIVNTLSALILERKREIALLRVGGMLQREVRTVFVLESMILGISASILGALCGWVLSFILIYVINRQSFGWTIEFHPPWLLLFMSLTATFASTLLAGCVSGRFTSRIHLARELQSE